MPILGPRSLIDNAIPTGIDAAYLANWQSREGITGEEIIGLAANFIGEANEEVNTMYGGLWTMTERLFTRRRKGETTRTMTPKASEFTTEDGVRSDRVGDMLAIDKYTDSTEWSVAWLREAYRDDITDDLMLIKERWINRVDYEVVWRMLSSTEVLVGNSGYAPGWAIGTGTNTDYVPTQWMAYIFDTTHSHFIRVNAAIDATNLASTIESMAQHLSHHGLTGPKILYFSEANLATANALNDKKFAKFIPAQFRITAGSSNAQTLTLPGELQGVPGETVGWYASDYGMVEMKYHPRFPATYLWMGKSFGTNHPNNPLAIRTDPLVGGFGLMLDPQVNRSVSPKLERLVYEAKHGINVNDRLNGVAAQIATGGTTYTNPTIS